MCKSENLNELEIITNFDMGQYGDSVKTTEFHPTDVAKVASVTDTHLILWDVSGSDAKSVLSATLNGKNNPKFTTGKWNPHQNGNQVLT